MFLLGDSPDCKTSEQCTSLMGKRGKNTTDVVPALLGLTVGSNRDLAQMLGPFFLPAKAIVAPYLVDEDLSYRGCPPAAVSERQPCHWRSIRLKGMKK